MKRILKVFGWISIFIILSCLLWLLEINRSVYEVGIEGNEVHFKTPGFLVKLMCGEPDEEKEYSETTGAREYIYNDQTLFGRQGSIVNEEEGILSHNIGADFGAKGMTARMEYADNKISVIAHYQY